MIDIIIVGLYLCALLVIGILKRNKGFNFTTLSKIRDKAKNNKFVLVATIFASSIGGGTTFGISEKAFSETLVNTYALLMALPIDILIALYIVPKLARHYGAESIGDIMSYHYGKYGRYLGGISAILVSIGLLSAQVSVSGRIFEYILNVDYLYGVIISYGIVLVYTTIGGLQSVLFTNLLQFLAMIFAIPVISIYGIHQIGFFEFINAIPKEKIYFTANNELLPMSIATAFAFALINLLPTFIQRTTLNKNSNITSSAVLIKTAIYAVFLIFVTLNGLIAYVQYPEVKASIALVHLIDHLIPTGLQGLVVVGLLAAVMSTADSDLNVLSITLVNDIIKPNISKISEHAMLIIARIINVVIGSLSIIFAMCFSRVVDLVIFVVGFWSPLILVPLVLGLFDIRISPKGLITSSILGAISFLGWHLFFENMFYLRAILVGTTINLITFLLFYLSTSRTIKNIRH